LIRGTRGIARLCHRFHPFSTVSRRLCHRFLPVFHPFFTRFCPFIFSLTERGIFLGKLARRTPMEGRDQQGRFSSGNQIGPGRPRRDVEAAYLDTLVGQIPLSQWQQVVEKALKNALAGDHRARIWLTDYLLGKPAQILELKSQEVMALSKVLERFKAHGLSPIEIFKSMLDELDDQPPGELSDDTPSE
jgi:hypothetical protein